MSDARLTGRVGGLTAWSRNDPETMVGPAHAGFRRRFENLVVAAAAAQGRTLTPEEITVRADRARRAHMLALAVKSAESRRRRVTRSPEPPASSDAA